MDMKYKIRIRWIWILAGNVTSLMIINCLAKNMSLLAVLDVAVHPIMQ